jgi:hypothetical protein
MNLEIEHKITALRHQLDETDMFLGDPALDEDISALVSEAKRGLFANVPMQYVEFLKVHDGLVSSGVFIYSSRSHKFPDSDGFSHSFIEQNLMIRDLDFMRGCLVFGESDQDEYLLDIVKNKYQVRDKQAIDNIFEEFDTFDGLLGFMVDVINARL